MPETLGTDSPHRWLGLEFTEVLPALREESRRIGLAVTRPFGHSIGEGALRLVRVTEEPDKLDLLLAYERYQSPPRKKRDRKRPKEE